MTELAWLFVLAGGVPLIAFAATARPMRGENMMGFHLVLLPIVLAQTLGLGLGIAAEWRQTALPAAALYAALPGWLVAIVTLVFACFGRTKVRLMQLLTLLAALAPVAVLTGDRVRSGVQLAGGVYVVALGACAVLMLAATRLRPYWVRFTARRQPPSPDSFEAQLAAQQREDWAKHGATADFDTLLTSARATDPGVKSASVARLVASPEFEATLVAKLETSESARDAMACVRALTPAQRAKLAPILTARLDATRERFLGRVEAGQDTAAEVEQAMRLLDAGVGSYLGGGDLRQPLVRWQKAFAADPSTAAHGKDLRRVMWLVGARRMFLGVK